MSNPSPPKPWEMAGAGATSASVLAGTSAGTTTLPTMTAASSSSDPPPLPSRPSSLTSTINQTAQNYSTLNSANRFGSSPYGYGGYSGYSPYNRFSSGYGSMYGGYGGYGSYGGMYGGMPGMYGGMGGMPGDPNNPQSLTQSFSQSTQATFQLIEGIVGAFGGFAQMLESTYYATHSSFFAMVSVAEQFGNLRNTLGSILGIYTIMRWIRTAIAKLTGRTPPASSKELTPAKFAAFTGQMPDGSPAPAAPSKKPFVFFIIAVFGLPYLMGKLIKALAKNQEEEERQRREANPQLTDGQESGAVAAAAAPDASKVDFYRARFDFTPETHAGHTVAGVDLAVKKGDMVAVLSKTDPLGQPSDWWRCRARNTAVGYLPAPYLEPIPRRHQAAIASAAHESPAGSRAATMTSASEAVATEKVLAAAAAAPPKVQGKAGDISVESFQKGQFYS